MCVFNFRLCAKHSPALHNVTVKLRVVRAISGWPASTRMALRTKQMWFCKLADFENLFKLFKIGSSLLLVAKNKIRLNNLCYRTNQRGSKTVSA